MINIFLLLLACYGITFTFVYSKIMDIIGLRKFWQKWDFTKELFECSFCTAFYAGILLSLLCLPFGPLWIVFPFAASAFVYSWDNLLSLIDAKIEDLTKKH